MNLHWFKTAARSSKSFQSLSSTSGRIVPAHRARCSNAVAAAAADAADSPPRRAVQHTKCSPEKIVWGSPRQGSPGATALSLGRQPYLQRIRGIIHQYSYASKPAACFLVGAPLHDLNAEGTLRYVGKGFFIRLHRTSTVYVHVHCALESRHTHRSGTEIFRAMCFIGAVTSR